MKITKLEKEKIILVHSTNAIIKDVQTALDVTMNLQYQTSGEGFVYNKIIINKEAFAEDFFDLSTKIAGEILQKFINYHIKLAIVGDFSKYTSNSLKSFIYESNKGNHFYFSSSTKEAIKKLL